MTLFRDIELEARIAPANTPPALVRDINTAAAVSTPGQPLTIGDVTFFTASDGYRGTELWRTDGTSAGTTLVRDIQPGGGSSNPQYLVEFNGLLLFVANDGITGNELWASDGTSAGTQLVYDLAPGGTPGIQLSAAFTLPSYSYAQVGNTFYFASGFGSFATGGAELWKTDGTSAGTALVRDLNSGFSSAYPSFLTNVNGTLFFSATDFVNGRELWKSDGTSAGTAVINVATGGTSSNPTGLVNLNGTILFEATTSATGYELWRSDGTTTVVVKDIVPGFGSGRAKYLTPALGGVFFVAQTSGATGPEIWKTDGTSGGTVIVRDIYTVNNFVPPTLFDHAREYNGFLYFRGSDGSTGQELWRTDGTSFGTVRLSDFQPGIGSGYPGYLTPLGGKLYFTATSQANGSELFATDGNSISLVRDIVPGAGSARPILSTSSAVRNLHRTAVNGGRLMFGAADARGLELWASDGTSAGTALVADVATGTAPASVGNALEFNGTLGFFATSPSTGFELWRSDGTGAGTGVVADINPGATNSSPRNIVNAAGTLYFGASSSAGSELWKSDGTSPGTTLVRDIVVGSGSGFQNNGVGTLANFVLFSGNDATNGGELWRSDGTTAGTTLVKDIRPGTANSNINNVGTGNAFISHNGVAYFTANDGSGSGLGVWRSDGTSVGTFLLKAGSANPNGAVVPFGSKVYFALTTAAEGTELWSSDGTPTGTQLVIDLSAGSGSSSPTNLTVANDALYFTALGSNGKGGELYKSDGTAAGTVLVADINPGNGSGSPTGLVNVGGTLFFAADDGGGFELWKTDGTVTTLVRDIFPGAVPLPLRPQHLTNVAGVLYFAAASGSTGHELWRSDGTSAGTTMIDIDPAFPGNVEGLVAVGDRLYFEAYRPDVGLELFTLREDAVAPQVASITSTSANGTYATGASVNVTLTFTEPVTLNGTLSVTLDTGAVLSVGSFSGTIASATYVVQAGQTSPDLTVTALGLSGTLADDANNPVVLALPANNLGVTANLIINPPPPTTVTVFAVNGGAAQRSRVTKLEVTLANAVPLASLGSITVTRAVTPFTVDAANGLVAAIVGNVLTITFAGLESGSLRDGRWRLTIAGLNYQSPEFHRFFGDFNGDGTVDGPTDFAQFGFRTAANDPFDFNNDGTIDGPTDFAEFGARFGRTV